VTEGGWRIYGKLLWPSAGMADIFSLKARPPFEFHRNDNLDARYFFDPGEKPKFERGDNERRDHLPAVTVRREAHF